MCSDIDSNSMSRQATNWIVLLMTCFWAIFLWNVTFQCADRFIYAEWAILHQEYTVYVVKSDEPFFIVNEFFTCTDCFGEVKYLWNKNVANT